MNPTISTTTIPPPPMRAMKTMNDDFTKKEQQLKEQLASLEHQKKQHEADLKNQEAARLKQLKEDRILHLENAQQFEELSLRALSNKDKIFYAEEAHAARKMAAEISLPDDEIAVNTNQQQYERPGFFENLLSHVGTIYSALFIFIGIAFFSYHMVFKIGDEINALNKLANDAGNLSQMIPPSIGRMSFQKGWFTWMTIAIDLIALILIMAIIAPDKLFFLLPFTKKPVKSWQAFSKQNEEQKQWQSFAYVALILLFLAICQLGGK